MPILSYLKCPYFIVIIRLIKMKHGPHFLIVTNKSMT